MFFTGNIAFLLALLGRETIKEELFQEKQASLISSDSNYGKDSEKKDFSNRTKYRPLKKIRI